jgi:lipoate-protein ligase A
MPPIEGGPGRATPVPGLAEPVRPIPLREHLDADERLLRSALPTMRVSFLSDRAVSYGVGVPSNAPFLVRARAERIPTIRRSTGGSGLVHLPGDLVWSIVLPRADPRVGRDFLRAYGRFGEGAARFLDRTGRPARWAPAPGTAPEYCTLSGRGEVLCIGDRIVGGAAQHLTASALLHQGTISTGLDRPLIERVFDLEPEGPSRRLDSLRGLRVENGAGELAVRLAEEIRTWLGAC